MMKLKLLLLFITLASLSGCANMTTSFREYNSNDSVMVDVKQRAIISKNDPLGHRVVCAEPSPDALSVYAAQGSASAAVKDQVSAAISGGLSESGAYIGLRTQSIQLLRDALFRQCESYANGALTPTQYGMESKRYQRNMVVLLAIEQLTGAIKAPPVTIATSGSTEAALGIQQLLAAQQNVIDQRTAMQAQSDDLAKQITAAKPADGATADEKAKADAKVKALSQQKSDLDLKISGYGDALTGIQEALKSSGTLKTATAGAAQVQAIASQSSAEAASATEVTKAVKDIVLSLTNGMDDVEEMCITHLQKISAVTDASVQAEEKNVTASVVEARVDRKKANDTLTGFCVTAMKAVGNHLIQMYK